MATDAVLGKPIVGGKAANAQAAETVPPRKRPKPKAPPTGLRLLSILRQQSARTGGGRFVRHQAPELWDLAIAAAPRRGKFLRYRGIKFPLRYGIWTYVTDPHTDKTLVAVQGEGGWL